MKWHFKLNAFSFPFRLLFGCGQPLSVMAVIAVVFVKLTSFQFDAHQPPSLFSEQTVFPSKLDEAALRMVLPGISYVYE